MSTSCDVIVIFPMFGQYVTLRKLDSGHTACKTYVFINSNFLSYNNWKQNYKISKTANTLLFWVKVLFLSKMLIFWQKNTDISKINRALVLILPLPPPPQNESLKSPPRLGSILSKFN